MNPLPIGLTNAERPAGDKPPSEPLAPLATDDYWHGPASAEAAYWRRRALDAEAKLASMGSP